jgi:hypothetical protein
MGAAGNWSWSNREPSSYYVFHRLDRVQLDTGVLVSSSDPLPSSNPWEQGAVRYQARRWRKFDLPTTVPLGKTSVRLVYAFRLIAHNAQPIGLNSKGSPYTRETKVDDPATLAWEEEIEVPVTVLSKDAADVKFVIDPAMRNTAQRWIRPGRVCIADGTVIRGVRIVQDDAGVAETEWHTEMNQWAPIGLAFDVFLRDANGVEALLGTETSTPDWRCSARADSPDVLAALKQIKGAQGDMIFRPSASVARQTAALVRIWGEEIVFKDVSIVREKPVPPTSQP